MVDHANTSPLGNSATSTFLQSPAIARKLSTFKADGVNIRKAFEDCDFDRNGTIDAIRFSDVVRRFGLLQSERQLGIAIAEHACLSDRSKVNYEDFCETLELSEKSRGAEFGHGFGTTTKTIGFVDASGYDGCGEGPRATVASPAQSLMAALIMALHYTLVGRPVTLGNSAGLVFHLICGLKM